MEWTAGNRQSCNFLLVCGVHILHLSYSLFAFLGCRILTMYSAEQTGRSCSNVCPCSCTYSRHACSSRCQACDDTVERPGSCSSCSARPSCSAARPSCSAASVGCRSRASNHEAQHHKPAPRRARAKSCCKPLRTKYFGTGVSPGTYRFEWAGAKYAQGPAEVHHA